MSTLHRIQIQARNDTAPSATRRSELQLAYATNLREGKSPYAGVEIHSGGELAWIMNERQWLGTRAAKHWMAVDLRQSVIGATRLDDSALFAADLREIAGNGCCLAGASLQWANMTSAQLAHGDFRTANLFGAILRDADLRQTQCMGANLDGADLTSTHLEGADFTGASLRWADVSGAHLTGAIFTGANLKAIVGWESPPVPRG